MGRVLILMLKLDHINEILIIKKYTSVSFLFDFELKKLARLFCIQKVSPLTKVDTINNTYENRKSTSLEENKLASEIRNEKL